LIQNYLKTIFRDIARHRFYFVVIIIGNSISTALFILFHLLAEAEPSFSPLTFISFLMLFLACINFIVLFIGRSFVRLKEIGIRKVVGAYRKQVITQWISHSVLLSFISIAIGVMLVEIIIPMLRFYTHISIGVHNFRHGSAFIFVMFILLLTGIGSGIYPAIVLSRVNPSDLFANRFKFSHKSFFFREMIGTHILLFIMLVMDFILLCGSSLSWSSRIQGNASEYLIPVIRISSFFALVLVFLGLASVISLYMVQRSKEIAIRKTFGADVPELVQMVMKEFVFFVLKSGFVGYVFGIIGTIPVLSRYFHLEALRTPYLSYFISLVIALITVCALSAFLAYKQASSNPVKALRHE